MNWIQEHESLLAWLGGGSLLLFFGSLIAVPVLIIAMSADFFDRPESGFPRNPLRQILHLLKNAIGYVLIGAGVLMLVLPGQGLLTIAIGICLVDFPGKRRLEKRLVRLPRLHASIAWIRRVAGRAPLVI